MQCLDLRNRTEPVFQCLCMNGPHLSPAHFLVWSFAFPKANHIWNAGDPFTFIYSYISPQRTIMFNCYCRLYFTVAQGCVKKGAFALWLEHIIWNMLFYWFTNASQAESFTIHVTNKPYSLSDFIIGFKFWTRDLAKTEAEEISISGFVFVTLSYMLYGYLLPFIWQTPVDCPSS